MNKTIRKRYDLSRLNTAGATIKDDFELDKGTLKVKGILLTSDRDEMLFYRGIIQIQINGEEVIPDEYHAKLLMSGLGVAPRDRYLPLDVEPGNGKVKVTFTDQDHPVQVFDPYTTSVYLETEIEEYV